MNPREAPNEVAGGRTRWAHLEFIPINIQLMIPNNQIEDVRQVRAFAISADICNQACVWGNECLTEPRTVRAIVIGNQPAKAHDSGPQAKDACPVDSE